MHAFSKAGVSGDSHCEGIRPRKITEISEVNSEEGRNVMGQKRVYAPSAQEYEDHMRTHIPYRKWCECCVRGKAKNAAHTSEERKHYEVPIIAYDYMKQRTEKVRVEGGETLPTLVGIDYNSGWISCNMVPKKGFDAFALFCVVRDVEQSGYNRLILKSDQENSIKDIISAVKRERADDIDLLPCG